MHRDCIVGRIRLAPPGSVCLVSVAQRVAAKASLNAMSMTFDHSVFMGLHVAKDVGSTSRLVLLVEHRREWGALHLLQLDIADAFGSMDYLTMFKAVSNIAGARRAWSLVRLILGAAFNNRVGARWKNRFQ